MTLISGVKCTVINIEQIEPSIASFLRLTPDLINSKSILKTHNINYTCLRLNITAWLQPIERMQHVHANL